MEYHVPNIAEATHCILWIRQAKTERTEVRGEWAPNKKSVEDMRLASDDYRDLLQRKLIPLFGVPNFFHDGRFASVITLSELFNPPAAIPEHRIAHHFDFRKIDNGKWYNDAKTKGLTFSDMVRLASKEVDELFEGQFKNAQDDFDDFLLDERNINERLRVVVGSDPFISLCLLALSEQGVLQNVRLGLYELQAFVITLKICLHEDDGTIDVLRVRSFTPQSLRIKFLNSSDELQPTES